MDLWVKARNSLNTPKPGARAAGGPVSTPAKNVSGSEGLAQNRNACAHGERVEKGSKPADKQREAIRGGWRGPGG